MLTVALFLLQIGLVYAITGRFFGLFAARILALAYGTSAGIIAFSHFLTADIPLTTWMLAAFYFAQNVLLRGRLLDYVMAGALTGIAAATKYNGLAIGHHVGRGACAHDRAPVLGKGRLRCPPASRHRSRAARVHHRQSVQYPRCSGVH